jgi:hypothetical protein
VAGKIRSVDADSLSLAPSGPAAKAGAATVTVARLDALQVKDGGNPFDILYSGRSSWHDVEIVPSRSREHLRITLKSGRSVSGRAVRSNEAEVTIRPSHDNEKILKADIDQVYYVRVKPASDRITKGPTEFPWSSLYVLLDPLAWPYVFNVGVQMEVPLYNSALPEDNSVLQCGSKP